MMRIALQVHRLQGIPRLMFALPTPQGLFWKYAEVTGNERWKGMTWGMLPSLGSAMCACTWHLFYNAPELEDLVALQVSWLQRLGCRELVVGSWVN